MKDEKDTSTDREPTPHDPTTDPNVPVDTYPGVHGGPAFAPKVPTEETAVDDEAEAALVDRVPPRPGTRTLRTARLGDLEGLGLVIVVRDSDGHVVSMDGTWRPNDETVRLEDLQKAFPKGAVVTFAGTQVEAADERSSAEIRMEVVIRRLGEYARDDGRTLRVVNFTRHEAG